MASLSKHLYEAATFIYLFIKALQHKCWRSVGHQVLQPAKDGKLGLCEYKTNLEHWTEVLESKEPNYTAGAGVK